MLTVLLLSFLSPASIGFFVQDEQFMSAMEIIARNGYPAEAHKVVTDDGYILTMHRMPHGRNNSEGTRGGRPVLLLHGLLCSSFEFLSQRPEKSLSYALADEGYNVWLGNTRGNIYSLEHVTYTSTDPRFWNFSWDEMAAYDAPAMVDYVLNFTNHSELYFVGHSLRPLVLVASTASRTVIQPKIKHHFALAPALIVRVTDVNSPLFELVVHNHLIIEDVVSLIPPEIFALPLLFPFCGRTILLTTCKWLLSEIAGPVNQLDESRLSVFTAHFPAGTSSKNLDHCLQLVENGTNHFDYRTTGNLALYGTPVPQPYNFSSYSVPTSLFYSYEDKIVTSESIKLGIELLPASTIIHNRKLKGFSHFLWGNRAKREIYNQIIRRDGTD